MSSEKAIPPHPPPPPPICNFGRSFAIAANGNRSVSEDVIDVIDAIDVEGCKWARDFPELRKCCSRNGIFASKEPARWRYRNFDSLLQQGPTCGLVALCMLLRNRLSVSELLSDAKRLNTTNNGEMFSARSMLGLCLSVAHENDKIAVQLCKGNLADVDYVNALLDGCSLLVPYDSDRNHSPCLKNGHSAHWALVAGILIERTSDRFDGIYVIAKHGKSSNVAVWKLSALAASNANLRQISDKRLNDELSYVIPEGGLDGENGLCNQFILIRHL